MDVTTNAIREDGGRTAAGDPGDVPAAGTVDGLAEAAPEESSMRGVEFPEFGADPAFFLKRVEDG